MEYFTKQFKRSLFVFGLLVMLQSLSIGHAVAGNSFTKFNNKNELVRPTGYREWIYIGAPLTPNDMNNGKAAFPEFHNASNSPDQCKHYEIQERLPYHCSYR